METREKLDGYICRYYDDWLRCSQRWCSMFGIPQEAYDLFADVLESLCRKPEAQLSEMIALEEVGERKLFFFVRKALRYTILDYRFNRYRISCTLDLFSDVQHPEVRTEITDELFDAFREEEAKFRADDFIDPGRQYDGSGRLARYVTHIKTPYGARTLVRYQSTTQDGHVRQFGRRTSAIAFLTEGDTPPRKTRREYA